MSQHHKIHLQLAELVRDLSQEDLTDSDAVLRDITAAAARMVPGADAAGMTIVEKGHRVRTLGGTSAYADVLDDIQNRTQEGPCLEAAWEDHLVEVADLGRETRWPAFAAAALAETPCRASLSFRLFTHRSTMGALNIYAESAHAFSEESIEIGVIYATHSAVLWEAHLRDSQFRSALASRDLIGQAKGMLMERFGIDARHAFNLLTRLSQESNTKVVDIARRVVEAEHPAEHPSEVSDRP
ncbi:GAF and ANTAR domain-containing protein [Mycobacterium sp. WMMD1722]|uniref:GAF and ANTAR domain-containing protein n=1 Tax=Mycobacterium sp. WMMD1722 TaxID=3404117 RepID=UPI003BF4D13E